MLLSDDIINTSVVPEGKTQLKISDHGGLYLLVKRSGRYWKLAYRFEGKQKSLSLGVYPKVSLEEARAKREEAKHLLTQHIDPSIVKKQRKLKLHIPTVESAEEPFVADHIREDKPLNIQYHSIIAKCDMSVTEERRSVILQIIAKANDYKMNEIEIQNELDKRGMKASFDRIRTDLAWLSEQEVITLQTESDWLVFLTQYGVDVVLARTWVPGINQQKHC